MDIPAQCQALANEVADLRADLAQAIADVAAARGSAQKAAAAAVVHEIESRIEPKAAELNRCVGCLDPLPAVWNDPVSLSRITVGHPLFGTTGMTIGADRFGGASTVGLGLTFNGCDREYIGPRNWRMNFRAFSFTLIVRRQFPDFISLFPSPMYTTAPYRIPVIGSGVVSVTYGRFERSTGHIDLSCQVRFSWSHFPSPLWPWERSLYGLNFDDTTIGTVFTTRTVPSAVTPAAAALTGSPLTPPSNSIRFVASGTLTGGFAAGFPIDFVWDGNLQPALP